MKRSQRIRLVLLGGLTAGAVTGCAPTVREPRVSADSAYTNDYHLPGAGFYHAPFHGFFPRPYNYFDPVLKQYYYGGTWGPVPYRSVVNISEPTAAAALAAETARTDIIRGGFGSTSSGGYYIWS